ncbi:MAG: MFS transporter [Spirochaetes bacterium]|nr:MFS transporter [Spirochaetota bacterium]HOD15675.1 MFS transporter [Spirochaetota bacterium]HPG50412.1 MFS transporter [Spirochaetota bacterium]
MKKKLFSYNQYKYIIFWILAVSYVLVYFHRLCAAVVAVDMMEDLDTGGALMGLLGAAYFYPYALMQLPAGLLSDSWGPRRTITLFFIIAFVGSIVQGMAPTVFWAITGRAMVGTGVAMLFVPTMKILAEWFTRKEFSSMTGVLIAMGGLGTLIATSPLALLSNAFGWRLSFVIIGIITLVSALLVGVVVRDRPSDAGFEVTLDTRAVTDDRIGLAAGVRMVLGHPRFWTLGAWFFFGCAIFFNFGGLWGGPFLMQVYHLSKAESGNILSMLAVGMIIGSPLLSFLSDRIFKSRKKMIIMSSVMSLVLTSILAFHTTGIPLPLLYVLCFFMGFSTNAIVVVGFAAAKELFPVQIAGTSTGLVNLFPFLGGAIFQPGLGHILERYGKVAGSFTVDGYEAAFFILFCSSCLALVSSFLIKETVNG